MSAAEMPQAQFDLLSELIAARGPAGEEEEVAVICERELGAICDEAWQDEAGNVIGRISAAPGTDTPPLTIMAHMDEIALIVKRVYGEGQLRVIKLGGLLPMSFGQIPVDILGDEAIVPGVLSIGSLHVTKETARLTQRSDDQLDWEDMFITTRLSIAELKARGIHAGTRVVVGPYMRRLFQFEDCTAGHFMDDRALIVVGFETLRGLARHRSQLTRDVYMVCTIAEEVTNAGAFHAAQTLPRGDVVALEVGPVAAEYDTELSEKPIILYGDRKGFHSKKFTDRMKRAAEAEGLQPQLALFENFASDASALLTHGHACSGTALCVPTQNTHGFEIIHNKAIDAASRTLTRFILDGAI